MPASFLYIAVLQFDFYNSRSAKRRNKRIKKKFKFFKLFFEKVLTLIYIRVIISESPDGDGNE